MRTHAGLDWEEERAERCTRCQEGEGGMFGGGMCEGKVR